jgi:hypothetical protein
MSPSINETDSKIIQAGDTILFTEIHNLLGYILNKEDLSGSNLSL